MRAYGIAFAGLTILGRMSSAHAECRPAAVPQGDPQLVSSLRERLTANGIETEPEPHCPAVRVQVAQHGLQVHLRVTDAYERLGEREVQDVATAAAVIESWTLQEIDAGSLPVDSTAASTTIAVSRSTPSFGLGMAFRSALTEQSSTWIGGSISGCVRLGWSCIGATVGLTKDVEATGATSTDDHHLMQMDARGVAEVPRSLAGFGVSPGLSLGYGWQRIASDHLDQYMHPSMQTDSSHALRAGLHLRVSRSVAERVAIYAELAADRSLARSGPTLGPESWFGLSLGARYGSL